MIEFRFDRLRLDGEVISTDWDVLLRIVGEFAIVVPPAFIPLYKEEEFCVVEFASQITQWLASTSRQVADFSYNSLESEESGLVSICRRGNGWRVAALHQDYLEERLFSLEEIRSGATQYVSRLTNEVRNKFKVDISHLVSGGPLAL